jgi:putative pyruvate formate lyase activating enzyme
LLVRHLVLPDGLAGTEQAMEFLANDISRNVRVSLMEQYFPAYKAVHDPKLSRKIRPAEYEEAVRAFHRYGLRNGWMQECSPQ